MLVQRLAYCDRPSFKCVLCTLIVMSIPPLSMHQNSKSAVLAQYTSEYDFQHTLKPLYKFLYYAHGYEVQIGSMYNVIIMSLLVSKPIYLLVGISCKL